MTYNTSLTAEECRHKLIATPAWDTGEGEDTMVRQWTFADFNAAMRFAEAVAALAQEQNHHPDMLISYNTVTLTLQTHSAGGLTDKDFAVAEAIDRLPEGYGQQEKAEDFLAG